MIAVRQHPDPAVSAYDAVTGRRSVRAFLADAVPDETVDRILSAAARAPSGQNMQPWLVHVVTGDTRARLCREVASAVRQGERSDEYAYFPPEIREPYRARRRKVGFDLFAIYGIGRDDIAGRQEALLRNFDFFGAPVGLFVHMPRLMGPPQWADLGLWLQTVMLLLVEAGLGSCPQEAWSAYPQTIKRVAGIPDDHLLFCGLAIGWPDPDAPVNSFANARAPLEETVRFLD